MSWWASSTEKNITQNQKNCFVQSAVESIAEDSKSLCGLSWKMDKFMKEKSLIN